MVSFRHFNRVRTWIDIVPCLDPDQKAPHWKTLEANFRSATALMKPFSRPPRVNDSDGYMIGEDVTENALFFFRGLYNSQNAQQAADILCNGVKTPEQFDQLESHMDSLQKQFPGALGTYRRKNQYDLWVEAQALSKHALRSYPVAAASGTAASLKLLYGIPDAKRVGEPVLRKLLVHMFHQVKKTDAFAPNTDSLATLSITLCGWHRSKQNVQHDGTHMSGLARAIALEEKEYLDIHQDLRDLNLCWEVQRNRPMRQEVLLMQE